VTEQPSMSRPRLTLLLSAVIVALAAAPAALAEATTYYLSLGDSLAVGVQPIGPPPANETDEGYADQLHAALQADEPKPNLVKLGCGGESTTSMRFGSQLPWIASSCGPPEFYRHRYPHKTQLAEAVAFLQAHKDKVALVTINIGANDVLGPGGAGEVAANLPVILAELRAAAGVDVPIVGMNYYGAFLPLYWSEGGLAALQAAVAGLVGLNDFLEGFYAAVGAPVADVESAFSTTDLTLVDGTPRNVLLVCQWTWFCTLGDVHPNSIGYAVIAQTFAELILAP